MPHLPELRRDRRLRLSAARAARRRGPLARTAALTLGLGLVACATPGVKDGAAVGAGVGAAAGAAADSGEGALAGLAIGALVGGVVGWWLGDPEGVGPDSDGDRVVDGQDNCPAIANKDQQDVDGDGRGDACDDRDDR